jgi:16S rRNA (cytosine967-C5)-methyltransferase
MKVEHQIKAFEQLLAQYDGLVPLHRFLITYFKKNKQMGSSDRRWASRYIYSFFRIGKALRREAPVQRLAIADFLCNNTSSLIIEHYFPDFADQISLPASAKLTLIQDLFPAFKLDDLFDFKSLLSPDIDKEAYLNAYFIQPDLFIRVDENHSKDIFEKLKLEGIAVKDLSASTLALPNGTKLDKIFPEEKHYQVQDLSSQKTGAFFQPKPHEYWWDCCAASGGKSLLLHHMEPKIQLLVSDVRENSLHNLDERFRIAGIKKYQKKVLDLLKNNDPDLHDYAFDGIILDAPCSGSGTWGRTPEMLSQFEEFKIDYFVKLQRVIAANVVKYLKPGKPLIYITCSVFKEENEDVVAFIQEELHLELETMEVIKGYHEKADTMFVARLIKK